ncbi:MAG: RNA-directed DNA polymerase, partial [Pseudomonadota bacterium]
KHDLGVRAYLRYVDDMLLLDNDKAQLWRLAERIDAFLLGERLRLHPRKIQVAPVRCGVDVLGYRVWPNRRRLRSENGYRFRRRLMAWSRAYAAGRMDLADIKPRVASWVGHAIHGDTLGLRRVVLSKCVFHRGADT